MLVIYLRFALVKFPSGNHKWHMRSFLIPASAGCYMFCYSVFYFFLELYLDTFTSIGMYIGYMFIFSLTFFMMCGTVGFFSSDWFVRKIYSEIRLD